MEEGEGGKHEKERRPILEENINWLRSRDLACLVVFTSLMTANGSCSVILGRSIHDSMMLHLLSSSKH